MSNTCSHCGRAASEPPYDGDGSTSSCESCVAARSPRCGACGEVIWPGEQTARAVSVGRAGVDAPLWRVHAGCAPSHVLRCAWKAWDAFGGPEEGGWTFEVGALLAAVPVSIAQASATALELRDEALAPVDALLERAFPFDGRRSRLTLTFELVMPTPSYPEETPRYE